MTIKNEKDGQSKDEKTEHYFSQRQGSKFAPKRIAIQILGMSFEMETAGGVFSPEKIDRGTELLIENAEIPKAGKLLDLGCGYGVVGAALKLEHPDIDLWQSDINQRAVQLARANLRLNRIEGTVVSSSIFTAKALKDEMFDAVLLNPPQSAGKDICFAMITESYSHLNKGGTLQLVARHNKGGKHLSQKMEEVFGNVCDVAKGSGYRVYLSRKE